MPLLGCSAELTGCRHRPSKVCLASQAVLDRPQQVADTDPDRALPKQDANTAHGDHPLRGSLAAHHLRTRLCRAPPSFFYPTLFHRPNCIGLPLHLVRALSRQQSTLRTGLEESPMTFGDGSCDNSLSRLLDRGGPRLKLFRSAITTTDTTPWAHLR